MYVPHQFKLNKHSSREHKTENIVYSKPINCFFFLILIAILGVMEKNNVWFLAHSHNLFNVNFSHDVHISI